MWPWTGIHPYSLTPKGFWNDIEPQWEDLGRLLWQTSRTSRNDIEPQWEGVGRPLADLTEAQRRFPCTPLFHSPSSTGLPRAFPGLPTAFRRLSTDVCQASSGRLPGTFRTSARNLPEVCQEPSGRLPGTFRRSARQASGRPRNDGDLPEVCQHPSLVFPTVFLTRCLPWEGGSARAWQTSGRFLADPRKVPSAGRPILLIPRFH